MSESELISREEGEEIAEELRDTDLFPEEKFEIDYEDGGTPGLHVYRKESAPLGITFAQIQVDEINKVTDDYNRKYSIRDGDDGSTIVIS